MSESEAASTESNLEALKALQADAYELERITSLLDCFNVFETIGFDKDELMHSNFLAFLLNPKRNDGLGDLFIKGVLQRALASAHKTLPPSLLKDLDSMDLSQTLVRREHQNIDILLTNEDHKLAIIIENKIWSSEHSGQLNKYDRIVRHSHPDWDVLKIYLTPYGAAPSHKEYISFGYGAVCYIVDGILEDRGSILEPDVKMSMEHYVQMVRRNILGDPEIVRLCQEMYQKHRRAFDLIYKHRLDVRAQIRPIVEGLIREQREDPELEQEDSSIDTLRFGVKDWDLKDGNKSALLSAEGWTKSERILLFVVYNRSNSLDLHLYMGPGPEKIRQQILEMVDNNPEVLLRPSSNKPKWLSIYSRPLLKQEAYENLDEEEREQEIRRQWDVFLDKELPEIEAALEKEKLIEKSIETGPA